jgi:hypothetical protein
LEVIAKEDLRSFKVFVGDKYVGFVDAGPGWAKAFNIDGVKLATYPAGVRGAVRRILEDAGYSKPKSVTVKRTPLTLRAT